MSDPVGRTGLLSRSPRLFAARGLRSIRTQRMSTERFPFVSTLQFKRTPRLAAPRRPGGEVHLEPPRDVPRTIPGNILMKVLPIVMIFMSVGIMGFMFV